MYGFGNHSIDSRYLEFCEDDELPTKNPVKEIERLPLVGIDSRYHDLLYDDDIVLNGSQKSDGISVIAHTVTQATQSSSFVAELLIKPSPSSKTLNPCYGEYKPSPFDPILVYGINSLTFGAGWAPYPYVKGSISDVAGQRVSRFIACLRSFIDMPEYRIGFLHDAPISLSDIAQPLRTKNPVKLIERLPLVVCGHVRVVVTSSWKMPPFVLTPLSETLVPEQLIMECVRPPCFSCNILPLNFFPAKELKFSKFDCIVASRARYRRIFYCTSWQSCLPDEFLYNKNFPP